MRESAADSRWKSLFFRQIGRLACRSNPIFTSSQKLKFSDAFIKKQIRLNFHSCLRSCCGGSDTRHPRFDIIVHFACDRFTSTATPSIIELMSHRPLLRPVAGVMLLSLYLFVAPIDALLEVLSKTAVDSTSTTPLRQTFFVYSLVRRYAAVLSHTYGACSKRPTAHRADKILPHAGPFSLASPT